METETRMSGSAPRNSMKSSAGRSMVKLSLHPTISSKLPGRLQAMVVKTITSRRMRVRFMPTSLRRCRCRRALTEDLGKLVADVAADEGAEEVSIVSGDVRRFDEHVSHRNENNPGETSDYGEFEDIASRPLTGYHTTKADKSSDEDGYPHYDGCEDVGVIDDRHLTAPSFWNYS